MKFKKGFFVFFSLVFMFFLTGCKLTERNNKGSIEDAIKQAYGDKEFKISFNAQNLDKPIKSLKFSYKEIPKLPTPEKLGYIFLGWFYDAEYLHPYDDSSLILGMKDVVLYAKWQKEEFTQDGIYEIKYEARILEETIVKEELVDKYGGIKDFTKRIVSGNTYIEKTEDGVLLKLEYDANALSGFNEPEPYIITVSKKNENSHLQITNEISSLSDKIKSIFLNLKNVDLSKPIYLDVVARDYETSLLDETDRKKMASRYTIEFKITKFVGFDRAFVDPKVGLEDGNYLVRTYYQTESNKQTMMSSFNPVYAYITAKDGNYKLIKPISPYYGLVSMAGSLEEPLEKNFFNRFMTFSTINSFYDIDSKKAKAPGIIENKPYLPEYFEAGKYGNLTAEYHADTRKFYYTFDLGTRLDRDIIFSIMVSGFMENVLKFGSLHMKMTIDYDHMVKLASIDYEPLKGDSFHFRKEFIDYQGSNIDLENSGTSEMYLQKYGASRDYYNFFYSIADGQRKIHSHKITFRPDRLIDLKNGRYQVSSFSSEHEIYGYDGTGELYADRSQTIALDNEYGLRSTTRLLIGKTFNSGEEVDLERIFKTLVQGDVNFGEVTYKEISKNNGLFNLGDQKDIEKRFSLTDEKVILYTYSVDGSKKTAIVTLKKKQPLTVEVKDKDGNYMDLNHVYEEGSLASFPFLRYKFGDGPYTQLHGKFYLSNDDKKGINPARAMIASEEASGRKSFNAVMPDTETFNVRGVKLFLVFDLRNEFDESTLYYFEYKLTPKVHQKIVDETGEVIYDKGVIYLDDNTVKPVHYEKDTELLTDKTKFNLQKNRKYFLHMGTSVQEFTLDGYSIIYQNSTDSKTLSSPFNLSDIIDEISAKVGTKFAIVELIYRTNKNTFYTKFVLNATISGYHNSNVMNYHTYFTETDYYLPKLSLLDLNGQYIMGFKMQVYKHNNGGNVGSYSGMFELTETGTGMKLLFHTPGTYVVILISHVGYAFFKQYFEVKEINSEVTVKCVTDSLHPFKDGSLEKEFKYNLLEPIVSPDFTEFVSSEDKLLGYKHGNYYYKSGTSISKFIDTFNSSYVVFDCVWDKGAILTVEPNDSGTGIPLKTYKIFGDFYKNYTCAFKMIKPTVIPEGFKFVGYESSVFDGGFMSVNKINEHSSFTFRGDTLVKLVFSKELTIRYEIDPEYSSNYLANDKCFKGDLLPKRTLTKVKEGYEFVGWYLKGDTTQTVIDYDTYTMETDIVLVAKFRHK